MDKSNSTKYKKNNQKQQTKSTNYNYDKNSQIGRMINLLGPKIPKDIKLKIKFDDEAVWSFTNQQVADQLCQKLLKIQGITPETYIIDATASIGGNTFSFARHFAQVYSIELNAERSQMLEFNLELLGIKNATVFNDFAQNVVPVLEKETTKNNSLLFVDPPWAPAGVNYKDSPNGTLLINLLKPDGTLQSFEEFLTEMSQYVNYIVCKLPVNYNFTHLEQSLPNCSVIDKMFFGRPNTSAVYIMKVQ